MKKTLLTGLMGVGVLAIGSADARTTEFVLHDHPKGHPRPPLHGLRLDGIFGNDDIVTFSFDANGSDVRADVIENQGSPTVIHIYGTVYGGAVSNGSWENPQHYNLDYTYSGNVERRGNAGWVVGESSSNGGTLGDFELGDDFGNSFFLLRDGYQIPMDERTWVGRGWVTSMGEGIDGRHGWRFTGRVIPLPGAASMAGLGLLGISGFRRRRGG